MGGWTDDLSTIEVMKASREGNRGWAKRLLVVGGVEGGVGGMLLDRESWGSSHRMTREACFAKCLIISLSMCRSTGL